MKAKTSKAARKPIRLINLRPGLTPRNYEPARENDIKSIGDLVFAETGKRPVKAAAHLVLSAANPKTRNKGWINAINCRNIFPEGPNIDFVPQESFGGKIELWLENVSAGDSYYIQFRVACGSPGNWEVRSSETDPVTIPIIPFEQSIDLLIPTAAADYGQVLVMLEAKFSNGGSWVFRDVIVKKINL